MSTANEVIERARKRIKNVRIGGITFKVLDRGIYSKDDCWFVTIQPTAEPRITVEYFDALAKVEASLMMDDDLNVMFVPIPPKAAARKPRPLKLTPKPRRRTARASASRIAGSRK